MINTHTIEDGSVQLIEMHGIVVNVVAKIIANTGRILDSKKSILASAHNRQTTNNKIKFGKRKKSITGMLTKNRMISSQQTNPSHCSHDGWITFSPDLLFSVIAAAVPQVANHSDANNPAVRDTPPRVSPSAPCIPDGP